MPQAELDYLPIIEILEEILGEPHMHNDYKCQISFDCPVCSYDLKGLDEGDGKGNLEVNYRFGVYKCWACGETNNTHGNIYKLIKKYGTQRHLKKYELLRPDEVEEFRKVTKVARLPKEFISLNNVSTGLKLTHYYRQAANYLKSRNVTDEMIVRYNIGFAYDGLFANRIIIPSYDSDMKLNYFIARSYLSKTKLKYKNPDVRKEIIIFNEHLLNWEETIYIVEGAFDSIFVPNSIPLLGKVMSDYVFTKVYENAKKVVVLLDGDAWNDAQRIYDKLNGGNLFGKVWVVRLPDDKDIADLQGNLENYQPFQLY
jgi:DNA primase